MFWLEVQARPETNAVVPGRSDVDTIKFELFHESISLRDVLTVDCLESAEGSWVLDKVRLS